MKDIMFITEVLTHIYTYKYIIYLVLLKECADNSCLIFHGFIFTLLIVILHHTQSRPLVYFYCSKKIFLVIGNLGASGTNLL